MQLMRQVIERFLGRRVSDFAKHWESRVSAFQAENLFLRARGDEQWVLLGDSLIEAFPPLLLRQLNARCVNRGISSDHLDGPTQSLRHRLGPERLAPRPRRLLLAAGINDLGDFPQQPELVVQRCGALLAELKTGYPGLQITVQALLPARGAFAHLNPGIRQANLGLRALADERGAAWFDAHRWFADGRGELRRIFSRDGLHLRRPAYLVWAFALHGHWSALPLPSVAEVVAS